MPFVPCPPHFNVLCFELQLIIKLEDQFVDEELTFIPHFSHNGDLCDLINQPTINLDICPIDPFPVNQIKPLDDHDLDNFLLS